MPNALLVYPKNPKTFWSYDEALLLAGKKSAFPPTGLLTVAGMLPEDYDLRLVDTNVRPLTDADLEWAQVVVLSGMIIHWDSVEEIIQRANEAGKPSLVGGPLATQYAAQIKGNATFFLGEGEVGFHQTLEEMVGKGYKPESRIIDHRKQFLPMSQVPPQRFDLIKDTMKDYAVMAIQTTRGCPESCTFCNIPALYGKSARIKSPAQVLTELQMLKDLGWNGNIMIVDDNIVGNQEGIMPVLKEVARWEQEHGHPYGLFSQGSLRMHGNPTLMEAMFQAGFYQVFIGIESPSLESLKFMGAQKNLEKGKSMLEKVRDIQARYFKVQAGFILGFDTDPDNIAELMREFIQEARISVAMVGPLGVLPDTPDHIRYSREGRLVEDFRYAGDSGLVGRKLSYIPQDRDGNPIDPEIIIERHRAVLAAINSPEAYFARTLDYLKHRERKPLANIPINRSSAMAFARSLYHQGIASDCQTRAAYWKYLWEVLRHDPTDIPDAVSYAVAGHHLITTTRESLKADDVNVYLQRADEMLHDLKSRGHVYAVQVLTELQRMYQQIRPDFRHLVDGKFRQLLEYE